MCMQQLGRLTDVPLREVWTHEAHEFTPWLLENADALGTVLGMDLELAQAEHPVGSYSLDLLGSDLASNEPVIIENQLEATDHLHLGQLLTYAAGTEAVNIVWISAHFRSEHRAALDWLNQRTDVGTRFFGVEVSAVRIEASPPAPLFRLIVQPNDWGKKIRTRAQAHEGGASERAMRYLEFWEAFLDRLREEHPGWSRATTAPRQNWFPMAVGISGAAYNCSFGRRGLVSEIYLQDPEPAVNEARFDALFRQREKVEEAYGGQLSWERLEGRKGCRIADLCDGDIDSTEDWSHYLDWFLDAQLRLRAAIDAVGGIPGMEP